MYMGLKAFVFKKNFTAKISCIACFKVKNNSQWLFLKIRQGAIMQNKITKQPVVIFYS